MLSAEFPPGTTLVLNFLVALEHRGDSQCEQDGHMAWGTLRSLQAHKYLRTEDGYKISLPHACQEGCGPGATLECGESSGLSLDPSDLPPPQIAPTLSS